MTTKKKMTASTITSDQGVDEEPVPDRGSPTQVDLERGEVDAPGDLPDRGHDDVVDKAGDNRTKGDTDHHSHRQVDHITAEQERLDVLHGQYLQCLSAPGEYPEAAFDERLDALSGIFGVHEGLDLRQQVRRRRRRRAVTPGQARVAQGALDSERALSCDHLGYLLGPVQLLPWPDNLLRQVHEEDVADALQRDRGCIRHRHILTPALRR